MDYIALAMNETEALVKVPNLVTLTKDTQICFITDLVNIDPEVADGVKGFADKFNLTPIQIVKKAIDKKGVTSAGISLDLSNLYLKQASSALIDFLQLYKEHLPTRFYLIFAFEWHSGERVRYLEMKLSDLKEYFIKNNGWQLWLYDYLQNCYYPDLDLPLIIEILNE